MKFQMLGTNWMRKKILITTWEKTDKKNSQSLNRIVLYLSSNDFTFIVVTCR